MNRLLTAACLASGLLAAAAWGQTLTAAQRAEVVDTMRTALKADPSILRDALAALQADDAAGQARAARSAIDANRASLVADPADPVAGSAHPAVTVVEFYDTRCPYCRSMLPTIAGLLQSDPGVRVVYKDIPILGPASVLEAKALLAAQAQGQYLPMQAALMRGTATPTVASIAVEAARLGLDAARLEQDMASPAIAARLDANLRLAETLHIEGTPALVIGDRMLPGAVDLAELRSAVAAARTP